MYVLGGGRSVDSATEKFRIGSEIIDPASQVAILSNQETINRLAALTTPK